MKKNFYIFRHGQSTYNTLGRTQGQTNDSVLTDIGKEQAKDVGKRLINLDIDVIVCSPLKRAIETANLANESLNLPIIFDDNFTEVNVGEIEGLHYTEIQKLYGEKYEKWRSSDPLFENIHFEGGETKKQVRDRIFNGLNLFANDDKYRNIAISSHGIMLTQTLIALKQDGVDVKNGAILHLEFDNGNWRVLKWI